VQDPWPSVLVLVADLRLRTRDIWTYRAQQDYWEPSKQPAALSVAGCYGLAYPVQAGYGCLEGRQSVRN
jgi:hypothetical protein